MPDITPDRYPVLRPMIISSDDYLYHDDRVPPLKGIWHSFPDETRF